MDRSLKIINGLEEFEKSIPTFIESFVEYYGEDHRKEIEDKFFKQGCVGVVTLSNDGREMESNNITVTPYNSLNSIGYKSK